MATRTRRAVVVGGGFGGLAVAVRLQALGLRVMLVEKQDTVGGRANRLAEAGYVFDTGPSLITAPEIIRRIFDSAGKRLEDYVELNPLDPYYRVHFHDGSKIDYCGDPDAMKRQMARFDELDARRYDSFMEAVRPIYGAVILDGLGARPFDTIGSMASFAPRALRLGALRPVSSFAEKYFADFRHRFLFSFHPLFIGGNPFRAPSIYAMIPYLEREQGVWFARGGMYSLVEALQRLFVDIGGTIRTGMEVDEIVVRGGRARGVRIGEDIVEADLVVSNADVAHTYRDLIDARARKRWKDGRLERMNYSMSCFILYLGVRRTYPDLAHHTLILSERYRALITDIFDRKILPSDFSMYLHAPTRTDSSMAPPGCDSLYVLVPVSNLQSGHRWDDAEARAFAERILSFLESWGMPALRDSVEVMRMFTPRDFEATLNAYAGNAFGPEPRLAQTAYFRPHNRSEDVAGLYLVGAGTHPGAGVPGVLLSAEATEYCIREDFEMR